MGSALAQLGDRSLIRLLEALNSGLLTPPFSSLTLSQLVPQEQLHSLIDDLCKMQQSGMTATLLAEVIQLLLYQREKLCAESGRFELVMTGPEPPGAMIRDTGVVVRQMFQNATRSICICGFAVYQGRDIFSSLASRMQSVTGIKVRMYLNIQRPYRDVTPTEALIASFQRSFRDNQWPQDLRLPEVYFDPRALELDQAGKSACLHAKFVIADSRQVFISSANFTEAAQLRNIEAGVLSENAPLANELETHFQSLIDHKYLARLRWN